VADPRIARPFLGLSLSLHLSVVVLLPGKGPSDCRDARAAARATLSVIHWSRSCRLARWRPSTTVSPLILPLFIHPCVVIAVSNRGHPSLLLGRVCRGRMTLQKKGKLLQVGKYKSSRNCSLKRFGSDKCSRFAHKSIIPYMINYICLRIDCICRGRATRSQTPLHKKPELLKSHRPRFPCVPGINDLPRTKKTQFPSQFTPLK
jgi:hypothetical protein